MSRWWRIAVGALAIAVVAGLCVVLRLDASPARSHVAASEVGPDDFTEQIVFSGLDEPTNIEFANDGRVFVAEKNGLIKVFASVSSSTYTVFADLSEEVNSFWDHGLLGLALPPDFPRDPYVYVLYTYDAPPGERAPVWHDECDREDCAVTGKLSRLKAVGNTMVGREEVLIHDWCQQFQSHSIGDLHFGPDGALYVSGGEGASFHTTDYGQLGTPPNICGDPPAKGPLRPPGAEGGALRSQDIRSSGDPTGLDGTILRLDPNTGKAMRGNPLTGPDENARRIVAYGLRNPYRFAIRPGTNEIWAGDVGLHTYEEINRIVLPGPGTQPPNYGWPCYEGPKEFKAFESLGLNMCEELYASGEAIPPVLSWRHDERGPAQCPRSGGSAPTGMIFYPDGSGPGERPSYPAKYYGALFFADYTRDCITVLPVDRQTGKIAADKVETFDINAATPVDLAIGPHGELYYVDIDGGMVRKFVYTGRANHPPSSSLRVAASLTSLTVNFDASHSFDPDPGDRGHLTFAWNFGDGATQPAATAPTTSHTYREAGVYVASVTITDPHGDTVTQSVQVTPGKAAPRAAITAPADGTAWMVGQRITFSGQGTDADGARGQTRMPASSMRWALRLRHCSSEDDCHTHYLRRWVGVSHGSFAAPDHGYPSHLELVLTVQDADGLTHTTVRRLDPLTVSATFTSDPPGIPVAIGDQFGKTPFTRTFIKGSQQTLSAREVYVTAERTYQLRGWSDGGRSTHLVELNSDARFRVRYRPVDTVNLALDATATADSQCSATTGPQQATDGDLASGWCSSGKKWLQIDLGSVRPIVGVVLRHAGAAGGPRASNTASYTVVTSVDGKKWEKLATSTRNTADVTVHQASVEARYVKVTVTKPAANASKQAHIQELEVLGLANAPPRQS